MFLQEIAPDTSTAPPKAAPQSKPALAAKPGISSSQMESGQHHRVDVYRLVCPYLHRCNDGASKAEQAEELLLLQPRCDQGLERVEGECSGSFCGCQ